MKKRNIPIWAAAFFVNLLVGAVAMGFFIFQNNGYFAMYYDYTAQEIPFNIFMNETVKSGNLLWNWGIDLGSNFLESFSFYNIGSVFFWLMLLVPAKMVPQAMGWMLVLKFAVAGATSAAYFARHVEKKIVVIIGSMLYAFSGFQCSTVVFYHFQDAVALFPLMMIGLEQLVEEKKKGRLALACLLNVLSNFVFFVAEVMFLVLVYVVRYLVPQFPEWNRIRKREKEAYAAARAESVKIESAEAVIESETKKKLLVMLAPVGSCMLEGLLGMVMAGTLLLPTINGLMNNDRVSQYMQGQKWLTMTTSNWLEMIKAFFMPADPMCQYSSVIRDTWMSNAAYLPLFGMLFVIVYILNKKKDWLGCLLKICFLVAAIPILNNVFTLFSDELYRRWYYMLILMMILATLKVLDRPKEYRIWPGFLLHTAVIGLFVLLTAAVDWDNAGNEIVYYEERYILLIVLAVLGSILAVLTVKTKFRVRHVLCMLAVMGYCVFSLAYTVYKYQMTTDNSNYNYRNFNNKTYAENVVAYLTEFTGQFDRNVLPYRYYIDEGIGHTYYNLGLTNSLPTLNSFNSTVNPSIMEFYEQIGDERLTWTNSGYQGVREILGGKYILSMAKQKEYTYQEELVNSNGQIMYVYENENALPVGYTYDSYMTRSEFAAYNSQARPAVMLRTLVVEDEDAETVAGILPHYDVADYGETMADTMKNTIVIKKSIRNAVEDRREECSQKFEQGDNYFCSTITADAEKYAFFSVPYDKCWKAAVNGDKAEILNINGLMAVRVGAGENVIRFDYDYLPVKAGIACSVSGIVLFGVYMISGTLQRKRDNRKESIE